MAVVVFGNKNTNIFFSIEGGISPEKNLKTHSDNYDKMEVFVVTKKMKASKPNRATPKTEQGVWRVEDHTEGDECVEELQFAMKDKYHEFSLGLSVVLECLVVAEKEGFVPPLPENWWIQLR